jgi:hypothetical protein
LSNARSVEKIPIPKITIANFEDILISITDSNLKIYKNIST